MSNEPDAAVRYEVADATARLTINRPDRRNALSEEVLAGLIDGLSRASSDEAARVVVITGAGEKVFCAGGDLGSVPSGSLLNRRAQQGRLIQLVNASQGCGKPTVARVNGHALGGGLALVLACDLAVASADAKLGTPEINLGLFPMMLMSLLIRHVGRKRALEMMFTGERVSATEARDLGMVNQVAAADDLDAAVSKLCGRLSSKSPAVLALGKEAFYATADLSQQDALPRLRDMLTLNTMLEDAAEGVMAFFQKRDPQWKGR
jgi:enoyl-CoA hydratase/carnithine racemase